MGLKIVNKVANVLAMCLSNQVTSSCHITTWLYDAVFVPQKRSLFHQEDNLISRIFDLRDNKITVSLIQNNLFFHFICTNTSDIRVFFNYHEVANNDDVDEKSFYNNREKSVGVRTRLCARFLLQMTF